MINSSFLGEESKKNRAVYAATTNSFPIFQLTGARGLEASPSPLPRILENETLKVFDSTTHSITLGIDAPGEIP